MKNQRRPILIIVYSIEESERLKKPKDRNSRPAVEINSKNK